MGSYNMIYWWVWESHLKIYDTLLKQTDVFIPMAGIKTNKQKNVTAVLSEGSQEWLSGGCCFIHIDPPADRHWAQ